MSQAYGSLGNNGLAGHWGTGVTKLQGHRSRKRFGLTADFSATRWRQKYTRILLTTDLLIIAVAFLVGYSVWTDSTSEQLWFTGGSMAIWASCLVLGRTRGSQCIGVGTREYKLVVDSTAMAVGTMAMTALAFDFYNYHVREMLLVVFPAGLVLLLASRWSWRRWLWAKSAHGYALSQVLVVGQQQDIDYVVRQLRKKAGPAYKIVGLLFDGTHGQIGVHTSVPSFDGLENLEEVVQSAGADSVIVAGTLNGGADSLRDLSWRLEKTKTNVIVVSSLTNVAGPRISMRPVEGLPLMHVDVPSFAGGHHLIKRVIDVALSATALLVLAPLLLIIGLAVRKDSTGPVFFSQERVGHHGQKFRMYKFRSMVVDAEAQLEFLHEQNEGSGPLFKLRRDPRVTKVGTWLRKYSLDEIPQIYNVLRGDMSLVGPRPPLPTEVETYRGHTGRRLFIKPGLTGLWQINGRSDLDWEESIRLDLYYVENWSLTGDLVIMWRTFKVLVQPDGAY